MAGYLHCCTLLQVWLVALLTGLSLGTINIARSACREDSILLINIIQVGCDNNTWSLYKKNALIIVWTLQNSVPNTIYAAQGYIDKFFVDKFRNIWIQDIQDFDEAKYSIRCPTGNTTKIYEVKLDVLVEPETRCKPKIIRGVDTLTTYLEPDSCGKPAAYAYWLEQSGISVKDNVIKIHPGQEAGTVYACIDSPSLRCAKNTKLSDYCSVFKDESNAHAKLSEISGVTIAILVITTLLNGFSILTAILFYWHRMVVLKKNAQRNYLSAIQNSNKSTECKFCKTNRIVRYIAETQPKDADLKLESVDERHIQSTEEMIAMIDEKVTVSYTQSKESDMEHEIEEASTEHQSCTNVETLKELQELRDIVLCKICFVEKMGVVVTPCNHVVSCANCSNALERCPICNSFVVEKIRLCF